MQYDFTLAAGQAQILDVTGTYFTYKGGLGAIRVTPSSGEPIDLLPGQGMSGVNFTRLTIKDLSGASNLGVLLAGSGQWRDERITGAVEVIDGGRTRTLAGQTFDASGYQGSVAAQFAAVELWNPVGSGKRQVVKRINSSSGSTTSANALLTQQMMTTLSRKFPSKMAGGAQSSAELRVQSLLAAPSEWPNANFGVIALQPSVTVDRVYQEPIIVLPGWGLLVMSATAATDITAGFEFVEELI